MARYFFGRIEMKFYPNLKHQAMEEKQDKGGESKFLDDKVKHLQLGVYPGKLSLILSCSECGFIQRYRRSS